MERERSLDICPLPEIGGDACTAMLLLPGHEMIYRSQLFRFRFSLNERLGIIVWEYMRNAIQPVFYSEINLSAEKHPRLHSTDNGELTWICTSPHPAALWAP